MSGFYLMHRGWQDNPIFKDEPFTEREAWEWIIANAAWKAVRVRIKSIVVDVERGQLAASLRYMAEKWQWLEPRVRRFLGRLEKEGMIGCVTGAGVNVVTVCNYEEYQAPSNIGSEFESAEPTHQRRTIDAPIDAPIDAGVNGISGCDKKVFHDGSAAIDAPIDASMNSSRRKADANKKEDNKYNKGEGRDLTVETPTDQQESGLAVTPPANDNPPQKPEKQKRGTRVPDGDLPDEWAAAANHSREKHALPLLPKSALALRWDAFGNYWRGVAGSKGLKLDWRSTWLNDCISTMTEKRFPPRPVANANSPPPSAGRKLSDLDAIPLFFDQPTDAKA